jgi:methionine-rich copper-binding protein CopC
MMMQRLTIAAACVGALLLGPVRAYAHAHLDHASPAIDGTVATTPKEVVLWFTEALEPKFSSIVVQDAKDAAVQDGTATLDAGNTAELRVALKPLPPGTYKVIWRVLSVDTHRTQGDFTFHVAQ